MPAIGIIKYFNKNNLKTKPKKKKQFVTLIHSRKMVTLSSGFN
jgi:hypothetical protein